MGAVSQYFNEAYPGIVGQAVLATLSTFAGMFLAYKFGLIKVTAKFHRIMTMMIFGYAIFAVVNFIFAMVTNTAFGFGGSVPRHRHLAVRRRTGSFTLALDFDSIEQAIRTGAPAKYSWLLAHGLIVTLVWLYIEFLRLFARLRSDREHLSHAPAGGFTCPGGASVHPGGTSGDPGADAEAGGIRRRRRAAGAHRARPHPPTVGRTPDRRGRAADAGAPPPSRRPRPPHLPATSCTPAT